MNAGRGGAGSGGGASGASGMAGASGASGAAGAAGAGPGSDCDSATFEDHAYWFCSDNADWDAARAMCQDAGGDLVSINSRAEQNFVVDQADGGEWLIGLNQKNASGSGSAGRWGWVDGTDLSGFEAWRLLEPDDEECGVLDGNNWRDRSCTDDANWICEIPDP